MNIDGVLLVLLWIVVIFAVGWLAQWVINSFFPEPIRTPAMLIVGVLLLVVVLLLLVGRGSLRVGAAPAFPPARLALVSP